MKRMRVMFFVLVLCCACSIAFGEEFALRNNVRFGDTLQEVIQKEAETGIELLEDEDSWYAFVELAGYTGTKLSYYFDDNNKLIEMCYSLETNENYSQINDLLVQKYGSTPYNHVTGKAIAVFSIPKEWEYGYTMVLTGKYAWEEVPYFKYTDPHYYHWFFEQEDGSVIQIYHEAWVRHEFDFRPEIADFVAEPTHNLGYELFNKESEEAIAYMKFKNSVANDI